MEVKGESIAAYAIPTSVKLTDEQLQMMFKLNIDCAELSAIALGRDYRVDRDARSFEMLECHLKSRSGRLKDLGGESNFQIVESELSSAIAYYLNDSNQKTGEGSGLEIVPHRDDVGEDDQIAINSEGRIYVSKNLKDKLVKVKTAVIYPRSITVLPEFLEDVIAHIVCLWEDNSIRYVRVLGEPQTGNAISPKNQLRTIKLRVDETKVEVLM